MKKIINLLCVVRRLMNIFAHQIRQYVVTVHNDLYRTNG